MTNAPKLGANCTSHGQKYVKSWPLVHFRNIIIMLQISQPSQKYQTPPWCDHWHKYTIGPQIHWQKLSCNKIHIQQLIKQPVWILWKSGCKHFMRPPYKLSQTISQGNKNPQAEAKPFDFGLLHSMINHTINKWAWEPSTIPRHFYQKCTKVKYRILWSHTSWGSVQTILHC